MTCWSLEEESFGQIVHNWNNKTTGNSIYICVSIQKGQPHLTTKLGGKQKKSCIVISPDSTRFLPYRVSHSLPAGFFRTRCGDRQSVAAPFSSSSSSIRRHHMRIKSRRGFFQIKFDQKARAVSTRDS